MCSPRGQQLILSKERERSEGSYEERAERGRMEGREKGRLEERKIKIETFIPTWFSACPSLARWRKPRLTYLGSAHTTYA